MCWTGLWPHDTAMTSKQAKTLSPAIKSSSTQMLFPIPGPFAGMFFEGPASLRLHFLRKAFFDPSI